MEFEIDEFALEQWALGEADHANPNHPPAWHGDCGGADQTGVWIPEESRAPSRRLEPIDR